MQKFVLIRTFVFILFLSSCSQNDPPYVRIKAPTNRQVFNAPEEIKVGAEYDDGDILVHVELRVTKVNATHDTLINISQLYPPAGNRLYHINESFVSEPGTQYKIVAYASSGHGTRSYDSIFVSTN